MTLDQYYDRVREVEDHVIALRTADDATWQRSRSWPVGVTDSVIAYLERQAWPIERGYIRTAMQRMGYLPL